MHASSLGAQHHRSRGAIPDSFKLYPELLRTAGYYCTNNVKTDYNVVGVGQLWDESSKGDCSGSRRTSRREGRCGRKDFWRHAEWKSA